MKKIPELLAPAGNFERLKLAILYGADAVYIGGKEFGLRAFADNFELSEMQKAIEFAHFHEKKIFVTMNIFAHNEDFHSMEEYVRFLSSSSIDGVIISDPGILSLIKDVAPQLEIHLSTQANNTNWRSACFWHSQGVKRIILARELSLSEIIEIRAKTPPTLELEAFVHGAMCISYSGRCALSNYLTGRDANRGECAQPCRWKYYLVEEKRPGEYMPILEDDRGSFVFNSKDLCMIEHIPELVDAGLDSIKIEGRMKTSYYVATIVQAYRQALDSYANNPSEYCFNQQIFEEVKKASHRPFTTGFYFNKPTDDDYQYSDSQYIREYDFVGMVIDYDPKEKLMLVEQRNSFSVGDKLEIMRPGKEFLNYTPLAMWNEDKEPIQIAPHPQQKVNLPSTEKIEPYSLIRRKKE